MITLIKSVVAILVLGALSFTCHSPACPPGTPLTMRFVDANNKDLLNYATPGHFYLKNIKLYTYANKSKELYTDSAMNLAGRLLFLDNPTDRICISLIDKTFLLELSPTVTDTLTITHSASCPWVIDKAWYNSTLVYDRAAMTKNPVVIVK